MKNDTKGNKFLDLSIAELYFEKKKLKNDFLSLGLLMLIIGIVIIIFSLRSKSYALIVVAICGMEYSTSRLISLKKVNQEIKFRNAQ